MHYLLSDQIIYAQMNKRKGKNYPPVNEMTKSQTIEIVRDIFSTVTNKYDFLNRFLSLRQDITWRNRTVKKMRFFQSYKLLDLATGTGDLAIDAANFHSNITAIGLDFVQEMVDLGNQKIKHHKLNDRAILKWGDATDIDYPDNTFDVVTMAFGIRNIPDKDKALTEMKRVVLPSGQILILELTTPNKGPFKNLYNFYLNLLLPKIAKIFTKNSAAYEYLADSIMNFPTRSKFISLLKSIGFKNIKAIPLSMGICTLYIAKK
jgi:demethylmenaquinone methyltransferase/2-methoxy-6-polyprenyl-1,4-benzoquinol methylase